MFLPKFLSYLLTSNFAEFRSVTTFLKVSGIRSFLLGINFFFCSIINSCNKRISDSAIFEILLLVLCSCGKETSSWIGEILLELAC